MNNNNTEKRVRQQKKSSHVHLSSPLPSTTSSPVSPPLSPLDSNNHHSKHISLGGGGNSNKTEDGKTGTNDKRRNTWVEATRRKPTPRSADGPTTADPFAGMKTCINYQQEIERLKTLVPKVEIKKRPSSSSSLRPNSTGGTDSSDMISSSSSQASSISSSTTSSSSHDSVSSSSTSACSPSSSATSLKSLSVQHSVDSTPTMTICLNDESPLLPPPPPEDDHLQQSSSSSSSSVITDEEKTRFLEFMRSWTGGLNGWNGQPREQQKGWMWNQQPRTRSEPTTPLHEIHPWHQHQQQKQYNNTSMDMPNHLYQPISSPPALSSYHQQPLYFTPMQPIFHQPLPPPPTMEWHGNLGTSSSIGTIGDRHRPTRQHGSFGVSVM
ncbi:hypothetical protein BC941DRAFT_431584 [Chlamydoabsidia padenii]|nr:hypothetical protein BC941DRAFT_431584 [Chlamydoabsidia padenii]